MFSTYRHTSPSWATLSSNSPSWPNLAMSIMYNGKSLSQDLRIYSGREKGLNLELRKSCVCHIQRNPASKRRGLVQRLGVSLTQKRPASRGGSFRSIYTSLRRYPGCVDSASISASDQGSVRLRGLIQKEGQEELPYRPDQSEEVPEWVSQKEASQLT